MATSLGISQLERASGLAFDENTVTGNVASPTGLTLLLKKELGAHAKALEVENVGGTVSVRGTLPDDARLKIARDAVKSVPGVKKVVDLLEVAKK